MKTITFKISRFAKIFIFSIFLFQQAHAQKTIIQEWNFDSNSQSNTGLEFSWPDASSAKTVSPDGTLFISAANNGGELSKKGSLISLGSISTGQLTYSITLKSWELTNEANAYWDLLFSDAAGEVLKHRIITESKTKTVGGVSVPYFTTGVRTYFVDDNDVLTERKVGKLNNSYASAGNVGNPNADDGAYALNSGVLPVTINFRVDLDANTYVVWAGDGEPSDDDGSLWGIYGGSNPINSGSIPTVPVVGNGFSRTIISAKTKFALKSGASNSGNEFIEVDKISFYTGTPAIASVSDANQFKFKFGPNPASSSLNVSAAEPIESIEFYSLIGQSVLSKSIGEKNALIDVSSLSSGVYTMKVIFKGGEGSYKLVVE